MNTGKFSNDQTEGSERERLRAELQSLARETKGAKRPERDGSCCYACFWLREWGPASSCGAFPWTTV